MTAAPLVAVVGSLNLDFIARTPRLPRTGETVVGEDFVVLPGGKGANQAVAASRQGVGTAMIGAVGTDRLGDQLLASLAADHVDATHVARVPERGTGVAQIAVDRNGDNTIVVVPRANHALTPELVERAATVIRSARVLLAQLEVPLPAVERALRIARDAGTTTVLNPAPATTLPDDVVRLADLIVPNETEAETLTSRPVGSFDEAAVAAHALVERGAGAAIVTLGARGALHRAGGRTTRVAPFAVEAVDATAAGDAFCGALAAGLARDEGIAEALEQAGAAGALTTTVPGAAPALPSVDAVAALRQEAGR